MLLAASSRGFLREQRVDLLALGFSTAFLDRTPRPEIHASERFAQLPPGQHDDYYLRVELRDANQRVLAEWQPSLPEQGTPQCSSRCEISRKGGKSGSSFWTDLSHTFADYPKGVRFIHWADGGRDADSYAGHVGTLIDDAQLTVQLGPLLGCAANCGRHGSCHRGRCQCDDDWTGPTCDQRASCPRDCSGRGSCIQDADGEPRCECDEGAVGVYCTGSSDDAPSIVGLGPDNVDDFLEDGNGVVVPNDDDGGGASSSSSSEKKENGSGGWNAFYVITAGLALLLLIYRCSYGSNAAPSSPRALVYTAVGAWSRVKLVGEELIAGRIQLKEAPARLVGNMGRPTAIRRSDDDDDDSNWML